MNLICPACGHELIPLKVGAVTIDVCRNGCGGAWFDSFELKRIKAAAVDSGGALVLVENTSVQTDVAGGKRYCPRCIQQAMMRHFHNPESRIVVDTCPGCGGQWFDAGELEAIQASQSGPQPAEKSAPAPLTRIVYQYLESQRHSPAPGGD